MNQHDWNNEMERLTGIVRDEGLWTFNNLADVFQEHRKIMEREGLLPVYEPRRISPPGGYAAFNNVCGGLFSPVGEAQLKRMANTMPVPTEITALAVISKIVKYRVPVYYVAEDFIRAVAATSLPSDFTLNDLHWPMPGMVLGFPVRFMREYTGYDICYVNAASFEKDEVVVTPAPLNQEILIPAAKVGWSFYRYDSGHLESFASGYMRDRRVDQAIAEYDYVDYTNCPDKAKIDEDGVVANKISSLVMKLLVVLNTRPNLVVPGQVTRPLKMKHGKVKHSELWSPNVIGGAYKILRGPPQGGTHASPRWHWRKGHVTHQRKGALRNPDFVSIGSLPRREDGEIDWLSVSAETREKFWACHERRWQDPVLVNLEEA